MSTNWFAKRFLILLSYFWIIFVFLAYIQKTKQYSIESLSNLVAKKTILFISML